MNKMAKVVAAMMAGALAVLVPTMAMADSNEVSLKLDPGAAVPLVQPQINAFGAGFSGNAKLWIGAAPFFSFGPSATFTWLGSSGSAQTTVGAGAGFMLRRPLGNNDRLTLFASPWLDADFQVNKVSGFDIPVPSVSVGAGLSMPLTVDRSVWIGPFVRYQDVFASPGFSALGAQENKIGTMGISVEFGPSHLPPPAAHRSVLPPVITAPVVEPPPAVVQEAPVVVPPPAVPFVINQKIQFAFDSSTLQAGSTSALDEIAANIQGHTNYSVTVRGFASSEGDPNYNSQLSLRRATTVVDYLTSHNVDRSRVTPVGMGTVNPVADNSTEAGRQLNRRVDFVTVVVTFTGNK